MLKPRGNTVQKLDSGVRVSAQEARRRASLDRISWDNMRLLLILAECGSFRSAATIAGISLNTIRAKIDRLERQMGVPLIRRSVEGVTLTQDGHELVCIARDMRALGKTAERVQSFTRAERGPKVRVAVTEGLGTFWLVPHMTAFREQNAGIHVDLSCDMTAPDILFRDTDIGVQLERPTSPDLIVQKIGTLHLIPFASERYLNAYGVPTSLAEAKNHKVVWQEADQVASDIMPLFIDEDLFRNIAVLTTNTSSAHFWAIAKGVGIGFLPTYVRAVSYRAQPIDIGVRIRRDIYLVHHPDSLRFPEVRKVLEWVKSAFDKSVYPWFADEFIHPSAFDRKFDDTMIVNLFEGFR